MIDIYFARMLAKNEIITATSKAFAVDEQHIEVIADDEAWKPLIEKGTQLVWVIYPPMQGDFPMRVEIVPLVDQLVYRDGGEIVQIIGQLCENLNCSALTNHGIHGVNPYIYILIGGDKDYQKVAVDLSKLEGEDELKIVRYHEKCLFDEI
jgi:hypothetical protein